MVEEVSETTEDTFISYNLKIILRFFAHVVSWRETFVSL